MAFGTPRETVTAYLTQALGQPTPPSWPDAVGQCEGGYGLWTSTELYGDLSVRYVAADASPTSPQTLASWTLHGATAPQRPLALADDIPVGLTMEQLQARYPGGDHYKNVGAWDTGSVLIIPAPDPQAEFFAGLMDWCI